MTILNMINSLTRERILLFTCSLAEKTEKTKKSTNAVYLPVVSTYAFHDINVRYLDLCNALQQVRTVVQLK